ncbi:MAG: hypothetical protein Q8S55_23750 [Methylococcaceae bacterium]|nr:hypothetical protein [Methylococcaceae bacterium]
MAQGKWYVLRDDGAGSLRGDDASNGAGIVNYLTGSVIITLGALPDVGSSVILTWGIATQEKTISPATLKAKSVIQLTPPVGKKIQSGSISITWLDGTLKTATATAGVIGGDATGTVNYSTNTIEIYPNSLPLSGTEFTVA